MGTGESEHIRLIRRWLAGEIVNDTVGIKIVDGPFAGRTKIVTLRQDGTPPTPFRGRSGRADRRWHRYEAVRSTEAPAGWIYAHAGTEPATDD